MNAIPDNAALGKLDGILADAFAIVGGHAILDALIGQATNRFGLLRDLATEHEPMKKVAYALRQRLVAEGPITFAACVGTIYEALPGDPALRVWIGDHLSSEADRVPEAEHEREREAYLQSRRASQRELAIRGFDALKAERGRASVAEEIARYRDSLRDASRQLKRLSGYKHLHEALHGLQTGELPALAAPLLKQEMEAHDERAVRLLHGQIDNTIRLAGTTVRMSLDSAVAAEERAWLDEVGQLVAPLKAWAADDVETLRNIVFDLNSLVAFQLLRQNRLLAASARAIPYGRLSELLRRSADRAEREGSPLEGPIEDAAAALDTIGKRLERMVEAHGDWQDVDVAVATMETAARASGEATVRELASIWRNLPGRFAALAQRDPERVETVRPFADELAATLAAPAAGDGLAAAFGDFAKVVRQQFRQVDNALLEECAAVADLEETLSLLVKGGG